MIQAMLVVALVGVLLLFTRREHGVRMQVGKRLAFVAFIGVNLYGVLRPDDLTRLANHLGVGRGADLLLYGLAMSAILLVVNTGLRFRAVDRRFTELVRAFALHEAELRSSSVPGASAEGDPAGPGAALVSPTPDATSVSPTAGCTPTADGSPDAEGVSAQGADCGSDSGTSGSVRSAPGAELGPVPWSAAALRSAVPWSPTLARQLASSRPRSWSSRGSMPPGSASRRSLPSWHNPGSADPDA